MFGPTNTEWSSMKKIMTALASVAATALTVGLSGCSADTPSEPTTRSSETTTTSEETTTTSSEETSTPSSSETSTSTSEGTTQPVAEESSLEEEVYSSSTPVVEEPQVAPSAPPFMRPEDYDPYGPPTFVECWEAEAALMSDGSIVTDTVNCSPPIPDWALPEAPAYDYEGPPRADGCVGSAAYCGYYDEYGNPTMEAP